MDKYRKQLLLNVNTVLNNTVPNNIEINIENVF